jgi:hypothetical protein
MSRRISISASALHLEIWESSKTYPFFKESPKPTICRLKKNFMPLWKDPNTAESYFCACTQDFGLEKRDCRHDGPKPFSKKEVIYMVITRVIKL